MQEMDKIYGDDGKVCKELNNKQIQLIRITFYSITDVTSIRRQAVA